MVPALMAKGLYKIPQRPPSITQNVNTENLSPLWIHQVLFELRIQSFAYTKVLKHPLKFGGIIQKPQACFNFEIMLVSASSLALSDRQAFGQHFRVELGTTSLSSIYLKTVITWLSVSSSSASSGFWNLQQGVALFQQLGFAGCLSHFGNCIVVYEATASLVQVAMKPAWFLKCWYHQGIVFLWIFNTISTYTFWGHLKQLLHTSQLLKDPD